MPVVTFQDYRPSPRYPPVTTPWTAVRIEESLDTLTIADVETITFADPDPDPKNPAVRTFSTEHGTVVTGFYRAVLLDAAGNEQPTAWLVWPPISWRPTVDDVGALLHARTNVGGTQLGTFTEATLPTATQVGDLISLAASDVAARVGTEIPEIYWNDARRLAALQAATLVEASFFPSQLDSDRSAYRQYQAMYLSGVQALAEDVRRPSALRLV